MQYVTRATVTSAVDACRSKLQVDKKADLSPVTQADRAAELAMRQVIMNSCPHHDILGEEFGLHKGEEASSAADRGFRWVLDPIDGTRAFITGVVQLTFPQLIIHAQQLPSCKSARHWVLPHRASRHKHASDSLC